MVFSYGYCWWQNQQWRTNAPHPPAISMARAVCQSNTDGIAWCSMSRATLEATGRQHWATTCSVLLQHLPGQHANKQQSENTPTKLAVLMAIAMWPYNTAYIAWWRRSRASLEATGCHHWASTCSNGINGTCQHHFFMYFIIKLPKKATTHKDSP